MQRVRYWAGANRQPARGYVLSARERSSSGCAYRRDRRTRPPRAKECPRSTRSEMLAALKPDICSVAGGEEYGSEHYEPTMEHWMPLPRPVREADLNNIAEAEEWWRRRRRRASLRVDTDIASTRRRVWRRDGWRRAGCHLLFINVSMWIMNPRESSPISRLGASSHTVDIILTSAKYRGGAVSRPKPRAEDLSTAQFNMRFRTASSAR